jgi:hypothetical protein
MQEVVRMREMVCPAGLVSASTSFAKYRRQYGEFPVCMNRCKIFYF